MSDANDRNKNYIPTPTLKQFHNDDSLVRGIVGPVGSGKSSGCTLELLLRSIKQEPYNGVRKTRWAIIRNSYPELKSTTLKTVIEWLPYTIFTTKASYPITGELKFSLADGTRVESEWIFLALDREQDVAKKLKSLEITGAWLNEASELSQEVLSMIVSRIPRYPKYDKDSEAESGATWSGIIMDTNAPDEDHWWYKIFEEERLENYKCFHQPPAVMQTLDPLTGKSMWIGHPDAENVQNIKIGYDYWLRQIPGKSKAWIQVYLEARYGESLIGKPVFLGEFSHQHHASKDIFKPDRSLPVLMGFDWGLQPAVVFGQIGRLGTLTILRELCPSDIALEAFIEDYITPTIMEHFGGCSFKAFGDPAGRGRAQIDKKTPFMIIQQAGIHCMPTYTNEFLPRREAVSSFLNRRDGFILSAACPMLRKALAKDYCYKKRPGKAGEYDVKPEKNMASHVADALQYLCLGIRGMNRVAITNRGGSDGQAW